MASQKSSENEDNEGVRILSRDGFSYDSGQMTNLMHNYVIQYVYNYNPLHVSSNSALIIRKSNCINTASGIVFSVSDRPVCTAHGRLQRIL